MVSGTCISRGRRAAIVLPLVVFLLISLVLAVFNYNGFRRVENLILDDKVNDLSAIADMKLAQVVSWRKTQLHRGAALMNHPMLPLEFERWLKGGGADNDHQQRIRRFLEVLSPLQGYASITLFDDHGVARISTGGADPADVHDMTLAMRALRDRQVSLSDIHRDAGESGKPRVDLAAPLLVTGAGGGHAVGAIVCRIDLDAFLFPLIRAWPAQSRSAETLLVRRDGDDVVFLNELRHRSGTALRFRLPAAMADLPAARAVRGDLAESMTGRDYRGVPVISVARKVPGTPWVMIAKVDKSEVFAPIRQLETWASGMGVAVLLLGGVLLVVWLRGNQLQFRHLRAQRDAALEREALVKHFDLLAKYANDIIVAADASGRIVEANERAVDAYGYDRDELLTMNVCDLRAADGSGSRGDRTLDLLRERGHLRTEVLHRRKDGSTFPVEVSARSIDVDGVTYLQSIIRDITERKAAERRIYRLNALYAASSETGAAIVHCRERGKLLQTICKILVKHGHFRLCWIGLLQDGSRELEVVAASGPARAYVDGLRIVVDPARPEGQGPTGRSMSEDKAYICNDFLHDPCTAPWHKRAEEHGLRASASWPLREEGRVVGALTLYAEETHYFDDELAALLMEVSQDISFALDHIAGEERRVQAEASLFHSEERFRFLAENASDMVYRMSLPEGRYEYVSPASVNLLGYTPQELYDRPGFIRDILPPDWSAYLEEHWARLLAGDVPSTYEYPIIHKSGRMRWMNQRNSLIRDEHGTPIALQGIVTDVTERREALEALRKSETLLKASQQMAHIGSWEFDLVENTLYWSEENHRIFEVDVPDFRGDLEAFLARVHPDDRAFVEEAYTSSVRDRTPYSIIHRLLLPDGRVKYLQEWCETQYDQDGHPLRSIGTTQDITERKMADEELFQQRRFIRQVIDTDTNHIFVKDAEGRFLLVNQSMAAAHGMTPEQMLGMHNSEIDLDAELIQRFLDADREVIRNRAQMVAMEQIPLREMGERWFLTTKTPMEQPDGTVSVLGIAVDITERKQAEEEVRRFAEEVADLYNNAPCGYHSLDADGVLIRVNDTELEWLGYDREEVVGKMRFPDLLTQRSRQVFEKMYVLFKERGFVREVEYELVRKDGSVLPVILSATAIYDDEGRYVMSRTTLFDVSERKRAETELRLHGEILAHMNEGVHLTRSRDGVILFANPKFEAICGYESGELIGKHVSVVNAPTDRSPAETARAIIDALERDGSWGGEVLNVRKDGSTFWSRVDVSTFDHHVFGKVWLSIHQDITARKLAEEKLRESEARFRIMADNAPIMIWMADMKEGSAYRGCNFFNQRWHEFTGRSLERSRDYHWLDIVHPEDRPRCLDTYSRAFAEGKPFKQEYRMLRRDGEYRWIEDSGVPRDTEEGGLQGFIGTCVDITDAKEFDAMRAEVEHAGRLNVAGEMASGLAHELSQPLSAANLYLDTCLRRMDEAEWDRDKIHKAVKLCHVQTERAGKIINHLKDIVRKQGREHTLTDINALIRDSVVLLEYELHQQAISVIQGFSAVPQIKVNRIEIEQVLVNLLKNAIDSMRLAPRRELRLATRFTETGNILVTVGDTGKGIAADDLDKIFNPFHTSKKNGLGLGLAICRTLVENHGGQIWAESRAQGGAEFNLTLPAGTAYE